MERPRIDQQKFARRTIGRRPTGRRQPGMLLAVVLVIALAPIGWMNVAAQLLLPTSAPSPSSPSVASARRAAASGATPEVATATPTTVRVAADPGARQASAALDAMLQRE